MGGHVSPSDGVPASDEVPPSNAVIVPIDGSEHARRAIVHGAWLAERRGGELVLVEVVDHVGAACAAEAGLEEMLAEAGLPGQVVVRCGRDVAEELVAEASARPASLLCLATRAGYRLPAAVARSVTAELLRRAPRPTVLVGPECGDHPEAAKAIVAWLDGSRPAEAVLPVVDELGGALGLEIWLAQVVSESASRAVGALGSDVNETGYLRHCAQRLRTPSTNWDVLHGRDPVRTIVDHCREHPGALPALATHGRTGADLALHGSAALSVAHQSPSPLVVVPPACAPV